MFLTIRLLLSTVNFIIIFFKNNFDLIIIKMEQKHQDIIKRNYSVLVKKMTATWVAERLFEDGIITEEMKENYAKDWI